MIKHIFAALGVHDKQSFLTLCLQFIKFGLVGLSNTAVSMGIYYLVLWLNEDLYMLGSVLGTILSIANAFIWNDLFVFPSEEHDFKSVIRRLAKTYVSYGGTSLLSTVLLWAEVALFQVSKIGCVKVNKRAL